MENEGILDANQTHAVGAPTDKVPAILAYCTLIGFIIGIVLNGSKEGVDKKFGAFHLRQALGLFIFSIAYFIAVAIIVAILVMISPWLAMIGILFNLVSIVILVFLILQIVAASQGQWKEVPVIGKTISKIFGSAFE